MLRSSLFIFIDLALLFYAYGILLTFVFVLGAGRDGKPPRGGWELNLGPLQPQEVLLTTVVVVLFV